MQTEVNLEIPLRLKVAIAVDEYFPTPPHVQGVQVNNATPDMGTSKPTETVPSEPGTAAKVTTSNPNAK